MWDEDSEVTRGRGAENGWGNQVNQVSVQTSGERTPSVPSNGTHPSADDVILQMTSEYLENLRQPCLLLKRFQSLEGSGTEPYFV